MRTRVERGYCSECNAPKQQFVYEFMNCVASSATQYNPFVCLSCLKEAARELEKAGAE